MLKIMKFLYFTKILIFMIFINIQIDSLIIDFIIISVNNRGIFNDITNMNIDTRIGMIFLPLSLINS
ncbi:hypothetical protein EB169_09530 [archaeon]|nr:hypothetical protein [archaeon]